MAPGKSQQPRRRCCCHRTCPRRRHRRRRNKSPRLAKRRRVSLREPPGNVQKEMLELSYFSPQTKQTVGVYTSGDMRKTITFLRRFGKAKALARARAFEVRKGSRKRD